LNPTNVNTFVTILGSIVGIIALIFGVSHILKYKKKHKLSAKKNIILGDVISGDKIETQAYTKSKK
jgi:putative exporter of polyketide antibiotics